MGFYWTSCSAVGCSRVIHAKQLCRKHYEAERRGRVIARLAAPKEETAVARLCSFQGCLRPLVCRGLCTQHYKMQLAGKELRAVRPHSRKGVRGKLVDEWGLRLPPETVTAIRNESYEMRLTPRMTVGELLNSLWENEYAPTFAPPKSEARRGYMKTTGLTAESSAGLGDVAQSQGLSLQAFLERSLTSWARRRTEQQELRKLEAADVELVQAVPKDTRRRLARERHAKQPGMLRSSGQKKPSRRFQAEQRKGKA